VDTTPTNPFDPLDIMQSAKSLFEQVETLQYTYQVDKGTVLFSWKDKQGNEDSIEVLSGTPTEEIHKLIMLTLRMTYGYHSKREEGGSSKT
jgi:hypothetical protein